MTEKNVVERVHCVQSQLSALTLTVFSCSSSASESLSSSGGEHKKVLLLPWRQISAQGAVMVFLCEQDGDHML